MKDLKKRRINSGLSQIDFAKLMDVTPRTVRNWESGEIKVKKGYLEGIKNVLEESISIRGPRRT